MPVSFGSISTSGASDAFSSSCGVTVPTGLAAGDILVYILERWESTNPAITWPTGFVQIGTGLVSGSTKLTWAWKRADGTESGTLTASWTGSQWRIGHIVRISGAVATGDPFETLNTATGTGTATPTTTVTLAELSLLIHAVASENGTTQTTVPTNFTNAAAGNVLRTNYWYPGSTGSKSASGGVLAASTLQLVALMAIKPAAAAGGITLGRAQTTETASALSRTKSLTVARTTEADTGRPVSRQKAVTVGRASETEAAIGLARSKSVSLNRTTEADSARVVGRAKQVALVRAAETDSATGLSRSKSLGLNLASTNMSAQTLSRRKSVTIGSLLELDSAFPLGIGKPPVVLGRAVEVDTAFPLGLGLQVDLDVTAGPISALWTAGRAMIRWECENATTEWRSGGART
jgi:hypothetical protein